MCSSDLRSVDLATQAEVDAAVASAVHAQASWAEHAPQRRARVLFRMKALVEQHADDLARLITREHGKTFPDAQGEVQRGLEVIEFACGIPQLLKGQHSADVGGGIANCSDAARRRRSPRSLPTFGPAMPAIRAAPPRARRWP